MNKFENNETVTNLEYEQFPYFKRYHVPATRIKDLVKRRKDRIRS